MPVRLLFLALSLSLAAQSAELQTVPSVDLKRYMGDWYELARTYNRYESHCVSDVRVRYGLRPDGRMTIHNECRRANGKLDVSNATAKVVDTRSFAKLKAVFLKVFHADYWIIDLDPEYRFAVVGEPDRDYLWVLSRTPELDAATYDGILKRIGASGYDPKKVLRTPHTIPGLVPARK